jgi:hypothetical protein
VEFVQPGARPRAQPHAAVLRRQQVFLLDRPSRGIPIEDVSILLGDKSVRIIETFARPFTAVSSTIRL